MVLKWNKQEVVKMSYENENEEEEIIIDLRDGELEKKLKEQKEKQFKNIKFERG